MSNLRCRCNSEHRGACQKSRLDYCLDVSFKEIKSGLAELPEEQQDQLAAYLVHLRHQRDTQLRRELSSRLEDKNPDHWVSIDQLRDQWKD
jgi:hypothetical protein